MENEIYEIDLGTAEFYVMTNVASFVKRMDTRDSGKAFLRTHVHSTYELFAVIKGEITLETEDGENTYSNSIFIVPPNLSHATTANDAVAVVINFVPKPPKNSTSKALSLIEETLSQGVQNMKMSANARFYCERLTDASEDSAVNTKPYLLSLLFAEVFSDSLKADNAYSPRNKSQYLSIIESHISMYSDRKIYLEDLADKLHLCSRQVARIIKKEYGCTLSELVNRHKVGVAAMMLVKSDMKISEISAAVGYDSQKDFRINFKRVFGIPPTEYRKEHGNKQPT
jgi:AraC-like DNA-binding protein/mannose-6-phosphate isomerase-like protein (cupin superfamily)